MTTTLEDYLAFPMEEELPEVAPVIEGSTEASQILRRLALVRGRIAENQAVADAETSRINEWERAANAPLERQAKFFEGILENYMRHIRDTSEGKTKSITLPGGKIGTTVLQPKWVVEDKEAFIKWAREQKLVDLYVLKAEPEGLPKLKKAFIPGEDGEVVNPDGGELVPGVKIIAPEQPYSIKISTDK